MKYPLKMMNETVRGRATWVLWNIQDGSIDLQQQFASKRDADVVAINDRAAFWWFLAHLSPVA